MIDPRLLHSYLDGELSAAERQVVEAQLAQCEASRGEVESIRAVKTLLAVKTEPQMCEATWSACKSRLDAIEKVEKSGNFISRFSWAFVAGVAMIVIVGGTMSRNAQRGTMGNDMLAGILTSGRKAPSFGVDPAQLDNRLKEADVNLSRLQILGSREVVAEGQRIVELELVDATGNMTMLVLDQASNFENLSTYANSKYMAGQLSTKQNCLAWQAKGKSFVLIGMRDHADLLRSAQVNSLPAAE